LSNLFDDPSPLTAGPFGSSPAPVRRNMFDDDWTVPTAPVAPPETSSGGVWDWTKRIAGGAFGLVGAPYQGVKDAASLAAGAVQGDPLKYLGLNPQQYAAELDQNQAARMGTSQLGAETRASDALGAFGLGAPAVEGKSPYGIGKSVAEENVAGLKEAEAAHPYVSKGADFVGELASQFALDPALHGIGALGKAAEGGAVASRVGARLGGRFLAEAPEVAQALEAAQAAGRTAAPLSRGVSAAFAGQMGMGAVEAGRQAYDSVKENGWNPEAFGLGLEALSNAAFATFGAAHALKPGPTQVSGPSEAQLADANLRTMAQNGQAAPVPIRETAGVLDALRQETARNKAGQVADETIARGLPSERQAAAEAMRSSLAEQEAEAADNAAREARDASAAARERTPLPVPAPALYGPDGKVVQPFVPADPGVLQRLKDTNRAETPAIPRTQATVPPNPNVLDVLRRANQPPDVWKGEAPAGFGEPAVVRSPEEVRADMAAEAERQRGSGAPVPEPAAEPVKVREEAALRTAVDQFKEDHPDTSREDLVAEIKRLRERADLDEMTGARNRDAYLRATRDTSTPPPAVSEFDIAGVGDTNKSYGEHYADAMLSATGKALVDAVGDAGTVYRKGGDEFVVHWNDHAAGEAAHKDLAQRLHEAHVVVTGPDGQPEAAWTGVGHYGGFGRTFREASKLVYDQKPADGTPGFKKLPGDIRARIDTARTEGARVPAGDAGVRGGGPDRGSVPGPAEAPAELAPPPLPETGSGLPTASSPPRLQAKEAPQPPGASLKEADARYDLPAARERIETAETAPDSLHKAGPLYSVSATTPEMRDTARAMASRPDVIRSIDRVGRDLAQALGVKAAKLLGLTTEGAVHGHQSERGMRMNPLAWYEAAQESVRRLKPKLVAGIENPNTPRGVRAELRTVYARALAREMARRAVRTIGHEVAHYVVEDHGAKHNLAQRRMVRAMGERMGEVREALTQSFLSRGENGFRYVDLMMAHLGKAQKHWQELPRERRGSAGDVRGAGGAEPVSRGRTGGEPPAEPRGAGGAGSPEGVRAGGDRSAGAVPSRADVGRGEPAREREGGAGPGRGADAGEPGAGDADRVGALNLHERRPVRPIPPTVKPEMGRPMKPGEAHRVDTKVAEAKRADPDVELKRDAPRTWKSLDPEIRGKLNELLADPKKEERFYQRAQGGKLSDVEVQTLDALRAGRAETEQSLRTQLQEAQDKGGDTGTANAAYLRAALDRAVADLAVATKADVNAGAELGRALAARARVMEAAGRSTPEQFLRNVFRQIPDVSTEQATELARILREDPKALGDQLIAAMKPGKWRKALEWWKAGLVSAPGTQVANILGNIGEQVARLAETSMGAVVDRFIGGERQRASGEAGFELGGALKGASNSLGALRADLLDVIKLAPEKIDLAHLDRQPAIGGKFGRAVRVPFRLLSAFDDFFKGMGGQAELHKLAWREAKGNKERALKIIENPPSDMLKKVEASRKSRTFQDPNAMAQAALRLRADHPWLSAIIPFVQTPSNIARVTWERSPGGFYEGGKAWLKWKDAVREGKPAEEVSRLRGEAVDKLARPLVGTAMLAAFYGAARSGMMTGSGPTDPDERNALRDSGWQPYSFVTTDDKGARTYIPFNRFEPVSSILGIAADMAEIKDEKKLGDMGSKFISSVGQNFVSKTYLQGLADAAGAWNDPSGKLSGYLANLAGSVVPNIASKAAQAIDPVVRDTKPESAGLMGLPEKFINTVQSRIPGASKYLPAKESATGEDAERPGNAVSRFLSPVQVSSDKPDADVEREMVRVGAVPNAPPRTVKVQVGGQTVQMKLTDEEYDALLTARKKAVDYLGRVIKSPTYARRPDSKADGNDSKADLIEKYIRDFQHNALLRAKASATRRARAV
jgi:GGDEF domain-containing protein